MNSLLTPNITYVYLPHSSVVIVIKYGKLQRIMQAVSYRSRFGFLLFSVIISVIARENYQHERENKKRIHLCLFFYRF